MSLAHAKYIRDNILGGVAQLPEMGQDLVCLINVGLNAVAQHVLDQEGVGLITNFEYVLRFYKAESFIGRL